MAIVIRGPSASNTRRPNVPVGRGTAPTAAVVQVCVADDVRREVTRGARSVIMAVAGISPVGKFIVAAGADDFGSDGVRAGKCPSFAGMNRIGLAAAGRFAFSAPYRHKRRVSVFAGLHTILTGSQDGKRLIGRVHFKDFAVVEPLDTNVESSLRELKLDCAVVKIEEGETCAAIQPDGPGTNAQLGPRAGIGPKLVARGHRPICNRGDPIRFTS